MTCGAPRDADGARVQYHRDCAHLLRNSQLRLHHLPDQHLLRRRHPPLVLPAKIPVTHRPATTKATSADVATQMSAIATILNASAVSVARSATRHHAANVTRHHAANVTCHHAANVTCHHAANGTRHHTTDVTRLLAADVMTTNELDRIAPRESAIVLSADPDPSHHHCQTSVIDVATPALARPPHLIEMFSPSRHD